MDIKLPFPLLMGVLNVTPDSFSDGGKFNNLNHAFNQAKKLYEEGAHIIDVGGESTRPFSKSVSIEEEQNRTLPVIEKILKELQVIVSIDTQKYEVAKEALKLGVKIINDVSGGEDERMAELCKEFLATIILMHKKGTPQTMQVDPFYKQGVVFEVKEYLLKQVKRYEELGVKPESIWVDPGFGFGKTLEHNFELLKNISELTCLPYPVVIGTSRKSMLAKILGDEKLSIEQREAGTLATNLWGFSQGAKIFRVHDVGLFKKALTTWQAIL